MKSFQSIFSNGQWSAPLQEELKANLVLAFGDRSLIQQQIQSDIAKAFPKADIVGCTTSGEIMGASLHDDSICLTAVQFDNTDIEVKSDSIKNHGDAKSLGHSLASQLSTDDLKYVLVISDGQLVNGTHLIEGITEALPAHVAVTGGLAGDGARFEETVVWHNQECSPGLVVLVGLYGENIQIGHGHLGGWREFGPLRKITKSSENVLYEFDGKPALELYKELLGEHADGLPASALLFPIAIQLQGSDQTVVRTILNIDEDNQSMTFAGNMPEGATCQLMRANYENLVDGAQGAAEMALTHHQQMQPDLAILISCVGRRLVLDQRIEEELEIVEEQLPEQCAITGFYSYGEISPLVELGPCSLHNQTMTITLFSEK